MDTIRCKVHVLVPHGSTVSGAGGPYPSALWGRTALQESFKASLQAFAVRRTLASADPSLAKKYLRAQSDAYTSAMSTGTSMRGPTTAASACPGEGRRSKPGAGRQEARLPRPGLLPGAPWLLAVLPDRYLRAHGRRSVPTPLFLTTLPAL